MASYEIRTIACGHFVRRTSVFYTRTIACAVACGSAIAYQPFIIFKEGVLGSIHGYVSPDALKVLQESSTVQFLIFATTIVKIF
uniref:Uncharacterized protein n=1 Tax=Acrobeloides nanus TaxID=290746 RepID=A0A914BWP1_9BILA